jgi:hypothetical protein
MITIHPFRQGVAIMAGVPTIFDTVLSTATMTG